jgi:hypothetical protein
LEILEIQFQVTAGVPVTVNGDLKSNALKGN